MYSKGSMPIIYYLVIKENLSKKVNNDSIAPGKKKSVCILLHMHIKIRLNGYYQIAIVTPVEFNGGVISLKTLHISLLLGIF